jgi:hypothetical protein
VDEVNPALVDDGGDGRDGGGAGEDVDLAGEAVDGLGRGLGDDAMDHDEVGVDERGEGRGSVPLDVADLVAAAVDDGDGVAIVRVERLADEPDGFAAGDLAGVVLHADYLGDDEAQEEGVAVAAAAAGGGGGSHGGGVKGEGLGWGGALNWFAAEIKAGTVRFELSTVAVLVQDWGFFTVAALL